MRAAEARFTVYALTSATPGKCPCRSGTITGNITKISIEIFAEDIDPGIASNVVGAGGNPVHVHVGPLWFMEKRESDFKVGDRITESEFAITKTVNTILSPPG